VGDAKAIAAELKEARALRRSLEQLLLSFGNGARSYADGDARAKKNNGAHLHAGHSDWGGWRRIVGL
jgi:hypothetical protein